MAYAIRSKISHRYYEGDTWCRLTEDFEPSWNLTPEDTSTAMRYSTRESAQRDIDLMRYSGGLMEIVETPDSNEPSGADS